MKLGIALLLVLLTVGFLLKISGITAKGPLMTFMSAFGLIVILGIFALTLLSRSKKK